MSYSVSRLTTAAECDSAILQANDLKGDLEFENTLLTRERVGRERTAIQIDTNLVSVTAQLAAFQAAREVMQPGIDRDNMDSTIRRLNDRKENLEERKTKTGNLALLDNELEQSRNSLQITEIDGFIAAVEVHKATL
ncbi:MAG TPA: hypothetical protein VLC98_11580 [Phnomibacter sp.]|nr:hypothetical protein [Phnomibacter sp.]